MKLKIFVLLLIGISYATVQAVYVPNSRETAIPPEEVVYAISDPLLDGLVELYSEGDLTYYFRESRDTIVIQDDRNGYTWKTGLDLEFSKDIDDDCDDVVDDYEAQFEDVDPTIFGLTYTLHEDLGAVDVWGQNGELEVKTDDLTDEYAEDDIQVMFGQVPVTNGTTYQISFDARANDDRSMSAGIDGVNNTYALIDDYQTFTFEYTATADTTVDLLFNFGYIAGDDVDNIETRVLLDNIMFEEFDGTAVVAETNQIPRGDMELLESEYAVTDADLLAGCRDKEVRLNTTYTAFANSLLTIEYYDSANTIKRLSSASFTDVDSRLLETNDDNHYVLDIEFDDPEIFIKLHIYFDDQGIRYQVLDEDISGEAEQSLAAILISPFLGASGGAYETFDLAEMDYNEEIFKYKIPGYSLVPDGAGSLIRFGDNTEKLNDYDASVYGTNIAQTENFSGFAGAYVPFKTASMPVFGISHGDDSQAAFVAFATEGDEYMQIVAMPEENLTYYNFTYPRYEYNKVYNQVYNQQGWGYLTTYDERNHFDVDMRYNFLAGDGSVLEDGPQASYVGMAQSYREYLIENGMLTEQVYSYDDIPIRLDFLLSDAEEGITGFNNAITTTSSGVDRILEDMMENNITNINSGLLGWQDGGITLGDPWKTDFTRQIGTERSFRNLVEKYAELGVDISFSQDYYKINEEQMNLRRNATQHTSSWYSYRIFGTTPINQYYYARPTKSIEWMLEQTDKLNDLNVSSYTIQGISDNLTADYTGNDTSRTEAKQLVIDGFADLTEGILVNAHSPNAYILQYVDRYLQAPVYGTQFLIETDTVPFVELVLQNTMELYGPYSNFSFYTDSDVLRMIDYNIYPSFVLTEEPAYLLTNTMSKNFYSTEYHLYEELITHVYQTVNGALGDVIGANWIDRTVVENGLVVNEYDNGVTIVINYTDQVITYEGVSVQAEAYAVIGG
jgi:hypothetical protein